MFTPGSATMLTAILGGRLPAAGSTTYMVNRSGRYGRAPVFVRGSVAAPNDNFFGRLRDLLLFTRALTPQSIAGVGYVVGASTSTASDALFAEHE
jgi:hypothetical protein